MNELVNKTMKISSREVAKMMDKRHDHLIRDIEKHMKILERVNEPNFGVVDLWELSSYKDAKGETRKEYQVTKKGCEFLAHKTTGEKGDIFTIRYMNKFEEMEKQLQEFSTPSYQISDPIKRAERWIEEEKQRQLLLEENKSLTKEVEHKEDVIIGLVEDIDLCEKRQRINQIIRHGAKNKYAERWNLLYKEFEAKYHIDLKRRIENCDAKPKIKNKLDYIDRELQMIPQLYDVACKIFEGDVEELMKIWKETI